MFKLLRFYSVASFISIAVAALMLALFYRQVTVSGVVELAEKSNITLAQTALSSIRYGLVAYLASVADADGETPAAELHPPHRLMGEISALMRDAAITRIKVYNGKGTVVFSTRMSQIGKDQSRNPAFAAALNGRITSKLVYRDTFNTFDAVTEEDNLVQTYLPVQAGPAEPIEGVFEIYTDVNHLVVDNERSLFVIILGAGAIMLALYGILVLLVRYARGIIDEQQQTIRERTAILEVLSAQMLKSEEMEKKKMAFELHEGLAQTLAAIKVLVENARQRLRADDAKSLEAIVPALQDTIREVRTMATELRPSSLDDLGLLPALKEFSGRFEELHPDIRLEQDVAMEERAIPPPLKVVLYRIVESAVKALAQPGNIDRIRLSLRQAGQRMTLEIDDLPTASAGTASSADDGELQMRFADMQERAILSGGVFSMERNGWGGITLRAAWAARPG